ncbi:MAG: CPBP family intramembrane metalloprotease [Candidatus Kapabacteria bacterium]|nr:CPBP family intramembrane metalloprotease [Candidatus Kapabacteria bacterium]
MILILVLGSLLNAKIYYNGLTNTITYSFLLFTFQVFFQAASEELMFRGIVFQAFSQKFGDITSAIFLSLVFAALHLMNPNINTISFINVFLAGIFFSACYIKTKSLWLGISFHFFWNWSEFILLGSPISGLNFSIKPLIELKLLNISPNLYWILGGKFGIEEGIITTILLISLTFFVLKYAKYSPYISSTLLKMEYAESKYITK